MGVMVKTKINASRTIPPPMTRSGKASRSKVLALGFMRFQLTSFLGEQENAKEMILVYPKPPFSILYQALTTRS
jgi:hypothetical protein